MARPATESEKINAEELNKLMKLQPSEQEAADWFDVKVKTLARFVRKHFGCSFVQLRDKSFVQTKIAIKRAQIDKALKGDNTMLIWCGKQYLGQAEKVEQKNIPVGSLSEQLASMTPEQKAAEIAELEKRLNPKP